MDSWYWIEQACQTALQQFENSLHTPRQQQADILKAIISDNCDSVFGQQHHFDTIDGYKHFSRYVPVARYDAFKAAITLSANGDPKQLTGAKIIQFEETGGSSSGAKLVPYTESLMQAFQHAILPWLGDLLRQRPAITKGRVFFMISPALRPQTLTAGGIPIGTGDDLGYFGQAVARHLAPVTLYSSRLAAPQNAEQWKKQTALLLLSADDLTLISLWSPTLLIELLDYMITHKTLLLGEISDRKRRAILHAAFDSDRIDTQAVWALLDTISCWDSHTSTAHAQQLQRLFPHVVIQGKGLLSTEAVTSLPYSKTNQPILAINSHFYEFIDESQRIFLAHQLTTGKIYRVIVTTQAGLYRYDTGDNVKITGHYQNTPTLAFVGKNDLCSDLCGEKLTESFVGKAIKTVDKALIGKSLLVAVNDKKPHYCWVVQRQSVHTNITSLVQQLEHALCKNPQYQYARKMGQLGSLRTQQVSNISSFYQRQTQHKNKRLGTIKLPTLLAVK